MTNTDSFFLGQFGLRCNHWQWRHEDL
jgi:hypothetical protein